MRLRDFQNIFIVLVTPLIFLITKNPFTGPWRVGLAFVALLGLIGFWVLKKGEVGENAQKDKLVAITIFSITLIGASSWFFSPFFFLFYLLIIAITFLFDKKVSLGFVVSLIAIFVFNVGEVDIAYDSLVLLSIILAYPVALYLRSEYLKLQEAQKRILVLEREKQTDGQATSTTVEKLLLNKVTSLSAYMRQPLVNVKIHASRLLDKKSLGKEKTQEYLKRIYVSAVAALTELNRFDEETTGRKIKSEDAMLTGGVKNG